MNNKSPLACALIGTMLTLSSCVCEDLSDNIVDMGTRATMVEMSLTMPLSNVDGNTDGYDNGNTYENTLSDYKIYFYDSENNKFIAELSSSRISPSNSNLNEYTITGELAAAGEDNPLENYSDFKVVMIANWESYDTPATGSTIETLCNSENAQYTALKTDEFGTKALPFYGVHTYTDVTFSNGETTHLNGTLSLLRAVAKVEIILNNEDDGDNNITLASATLHNYNAKGYCAPKDVNSEDDYGKATDWASDYTGNNMHLVNKDADGNGKNDNEPQSELQFMKTQDRVVDANGEVTQKETWIAYIPEYDNSGEDYSYIDLEFDHQLSYDPTEYRIYFAVYDNDGTSKAYDTTASDEDKAKRRSILRNNLYRYNVTLTQGQLRVFVDTWDNVFDNGWIFGNAAPEVVGYQFSANGIEYEVLTSPAGDGTGKDLDETQPLTIKTIVGTGDAYAGTVYIPSTVLYYGFTYTVTEIGEHSFDGHEGITAISIPATVTKIGTDAFEGCTALTSLYIHATEPPTCGEDLFAQDRVENITLYVPYGVVTVYKDDPVWGAFGFNAIEAIPD